MNCPYCESEMIKGALIGDRRMKVRWQNDGEKINLLDKLDKALTEKGCIDAHYSLTKFQINAYLCDKCEKIIINSKPKK